MSQQRTRQAVSGLSGALVMTLGAVHAPGGTVQYQVTFNATWSQATHPQDFPANAHFSPMIGGTHNADISFWQVGELASDAIESMAENGSTPPLDAEVNNAITAGDAFSVISGGGGFSSPGSVSTTFQISDTHPLATVVSMVAPSPDWFVGVSGLNLRKPNGLWHETVVVNLDPYDAGTDSGVTFTSANDDTQPPDPITNISNGFPFIGTPPLGTFTFQLLTPQPTPVPAVTDAGMAMLALLATTSAVAVIRRRRASTR